MAKAVFCIVRDHTQATKILHDLRDAGFSNRDISVLLSQSGEIVVANLPQGTRALEGAATGVGAGGLLGGALGWLLGIGSLAIPGVGPLLAAGPILAIVTGAAVGASLGGVAGSLVGYGIPENDARLYEERLRSGEVLISVHSENSAETTSARAIFESGGAESITTAIEETLREPIAEPLESGPSPASPASNETKKMSA